MNYDNDLLSRWLDAGKLPEPQKTATRDLVDELQLAREEIASAEAEKVSIADLRSDLSQAEKDRDKAEDKLEDAKAELEGATYRQLTNRADLIMALADRANYERMF